MMAFFLSKKVQICRNMDWKKRDSWLCFLRKVFLSILFSYPHFKEWNGRCSKDVSQVFYAKSGAQKCKNMRSSGHFKGGFWVNFHSRKYVSCPASWRAVLFRHWKEFEIGEIFLRIRLFVFQVFFIVTVLCLE